jgi:hypothetical protein
VTAFDAEWNYREYGFRAFRMKAAHCKKSQTRCRIGLVPFVLGANAIKTEEPMSKIAPCLWFADEAEEAANFYVSLLPGSRIDATAPTRLRSIISGKDSPPAAARPDNAAGSRIATACPGKSCRPP